MASRLWFANDIVPPGNNPAVDAGWNVSTGFSRRFLTHVKGSTALANTTATTLSGAASEKGVTRQFISHPLNGDQAISGTVGCVCMGFEVATTDNIDRRWTKIFVVDSAAAIRGTVRALTANPTNIAEWNSTSRNLIFIPSGTAITTVNAKSGDRIVLEIGGGNNTAGTTPQFQLRVGEAGTDAVENETDITDSPGWIEFSVNLVFTPIRMARFNSPYGSYF